MENQILDNINSRRSTRTDLKRYEINAYATSEIEIPDKVEQIIQGANSASPSIFNAKLEKNKKHIDNTDFIHLKLVFFSESIYGT